MKTLLEQLTPLSVFLLNYRPLLRASDNIRAFETYTHRSPHQVSHHHALTNKEEIPRVDFPPSQNQSPSHPKLIITQKKTEMP